MLNPNKNRCRVTTSIGWQTCLQKKIDRVDNASLKTNLSLVTPHLSKKLFKILVLGIPF